MDGKSCNFSGMISLPIVTLIAVLSSMSENSIK